MIKRLHWFFKVWILFFVLFFVYFFLTVVIPKFLPTKIISGEIRGLIFQNQIWRGTVFVTGDLITMPNVFITILPGTKVYIKKSGDKNNLDLIPWHLSHGINTGADYKGIKTGEPFWDEKEKTLLRLSNVIASGTKGQPITITSFDGEGSPYDINLIRVENGELTGVIISNYRRFEIGSDVKVMVSSFENTGECSICISSGSPLIKGNIFKKGKRDFVNVSDGTPLIYGNTFLESEGDGILIQTSHLESVRIFNNLFQVPSRKAIKLLSAGQTGDISGNLFMLGDIELDCNNRIKLFNNLIKVNVVFRNNGGCSGEYTLLENYWEIEDVNNVLNARISGISDEFRVKIPKILKNSPFSVIK